MKRSYIIAGALAIVAVGWIASGQFADGGNQPEALKPPADRLLTAELQFVQAPGPLQQPVKRSPQGTSLQQALQL